MPLRLHKLAPAVHACVEACKMRTIRIRKQIHDRSFFRGIALGNVVPDDM